MTLVSFSRDLALIKSGRSDCGQSVLWMLVVLGTRLPSLGRKPLDAGVIDARDLSTQAIYLVNASEHLSILRAPFLPSSKVAQLKLFGQPRV